MLQLIYCSEGLDVTESDLEEILETANRENEKRQVTGMLLYGDGSFIQVLEGPPKAVHDLYDRIKKDQRHENCTVLFEEAAETRTFGEWNMAYASLAGENLDALGGNLGIQSAAELIKLMGNPEGFIGDFLLTSFKNLLGNTVQKAVTKQL